MEQLHVHSSQLVFKDDVPLFFISPIFQNKQLSKLLLKCFARIFFVFCASTKINFKDKNYPNSWHSQFSSVLV